MINISAEHWFYQLSQSSQDKITALTLTKSYSLGQYIHHASDTAKHLYFINKGVVRISKVSEKGKELILKDLQENEWFGFIGCFGLGIRPNDAVALEDTQLSQISLSEFITLANTEPDLWPAVIKQMAHYVEHYYSTIEGIVFDTLFDRTKAMLCQLCSWQDSSTLVISHKDLASLLGVTKEAVGLQLNSLQSQGLILLGYKNIKVLQPLLEPL
ncbi:Crp/Fnr family transcriptional regulator [Colwellia demingiae]|uniref:Crp/Fnr family transcriptional regulator n=1 Tax=Colwellia demingiae TaxID=89401 RepID=UPI001B87EE03|nr:Crp/Fnr family transcriptional regulator [Colwellia demingiae]